MTEVRITEDQLVGLVRNALLVAGQEMGETGDHWPVIKATIYSIMKDWETLKTERNVHEELRIHLYAELDRLEEILATRPLESQAIDGPKLKKLREIYDAHFTPPADDETLLDDDDKPMHVKRAEAIILSLGENDA